MNLTVRCALCLVTLALGSAVTAVRASPGEVIAHQRISATEGNFDGPLDAGDSFGMSVTMIEDLDGDGVRDIAVGANFDDDGTSAPLGRGAVWILFLNTDGTVKTHQKISDTEGGFTGVLDDNDFFGRSLAFIGDLDGDGVGDLAVGASGDDDSPKGGGGAIWILFLHTDGSVKAHQKISQFDGGFTGSLGTFDGFGVSLANLGDLDGDGVIDLAVGAAGDSDNGESRGAIWILFLNPDGTVKSHQKISDTEGGFTGLLHDASLFGFSVAWLGDPNSVGPGALAVGAVGDDDGGSFRGAVWLLFLESDGTVNSHQKISDTEGSFDGILDDRDQFGFSVAAMGDPGPDGMTLLAVGANADDDGGPLRGAVWILFLDTDGTVRAHRKISDSEGGFAGQLGDLDLFGRSVASLGDLNGDGAVDLVVGSGAGDANPPGSDAVWVLFLDEIPACMWDCGDGDGNIGIVDLLALLANWGEATAPCDLNGAGIGFSDFQELLDNWGPCPQAVVPDG